jgi:C4-dicarboxylate-specific signal transduction histidine kinase
VRVRGGAATLYQILEELALNAAEGNGRRGALHVEVAVAGDPAAESAAIRIADDGPGLPQALLGRPVEPFTTTKAYGVGLGLYTAERLARASGGSLRLENPPAGGAAVTVYLELATDGASELAAEGPGPPLHGPTKESA